MSSPVLPLTSPLLPGQVAHLSLLNLTGAQCSQNSPCVPVPWLPMDFTLSLREDSAGTRGHPSRCVHRLRGRSESKNGQRKWLPPTFYASVGPQRMEGHPSLSHDHLLTPQPQGLLAPLTEGHLRRLSQSSANPCRCWDTAAAGRLPRLMLWDNPMPTWPLPEEAGARPPHTRAERCGSRSHQTHAAHSPSFPPRPSLVPELQRWPRAG